MLIGHAPRKLSLYGDSCYWIYAVRIGSTGLIKIGSTEEIGRRIRGLCSQFRADIEVLGLLAGTYQDERALHKTLIAYRAEGQPCTELYKPTPEIMRLVTRRMARPHALYDASFPLLTTYTGRRPKCALPPTLADVDLACHKIRTYPEYCADGKRSRVKTILINRLRRAAADGHDIRQATEIVRARLGVEVAC